jgi:hypothetical protein
MYNVSLIGNVTVSPPVTEFGVVCPHQWLKTESVILSGSSGKGGAPKCPTKKRDLGEKCV